MRVDGVQMGKVLRIDRPDGRRVLKFDGAFGPEGCGLPLRAMLIKSALCGRVLKMDRPYGPEGS